MPKNSLNKIAYGDAFRVGNHIVACADARDRELVDRIIGQTKIKSVIVDPPFGVMAVEGKRGLSELHVNKKILNDDIVSEPEYAKFTEAWITPILPHLAPKNSFYIFNGDTMLFALREGMVRAGVKFSQLLIWVKSQPVLGRKDYNAQHELLAYGWYGKHEFFKSKDKSVLWYPKQSKNLFHPSQKPVGLIRRLVLNSTSIGDTIYDCMAGAGTGGIAAEQTKRASIMIERDEEYCQIILERFWNLFHLKAEKIKNIYDK